MVSRLVDAFEQAWVSSDPARLDGVVTPLAVQGAGSLRLTAGRGAAGVTATRTPGTPLDLRAYDELRLWTYAATAEPYPLELSYRDAGDRPGEDHRWLIPVGRARGWERHAFAVGGDRRAAVTELTVRVATDAPFRINLDELLAVRDDGLADVEAALIALLDGLPLPGATAIPARPAAAGAETVVVDLAPTLRPGNRIVVDGVDTRYAVTGATHDRSAGTTTLTLRPALAAAVGADATVSVIAPVVVEEAAPADATELPDPVLLMTLTDQREEPERAWHLGQRDSFRVRAGATLCSLRPPPRPVLAEYQILPSASDRGQSLALRTEILRRVGVDSGLRVDGDVLPVQTLMPPPLDIRVRAVPAPIYLHVGTRIEQGARVEVPWVRQGRLSVGLFPPETGRQDQEGIQPWHFR
jgi:hypothetical protein